MERRENGRIGCGPMTMALPVIFLVIACGISEIGSWNGVLEEKPVEGILDSSRPVCCVTAVEYPGGYDWRKNPDGTEVRCSLVVFADGIPAMRFPVGDGYEISPDPEAHRLVQGHLYTFFSNNGESVVMKDGSPMFRYEADEVLLDMLVRDGDVHTLAAKGSGGFAYRKNGKPLVERGTGDLFGKLWEDGDSVCFAFTQSVAMPDGLDQRYYISMDADVRQQELDKEVYRLWDLRSRKGVPVCLVSSHRWGTVMIYEGESRKPILVPLASNMLSCNMFDADGQIGVECVYTHADGTVESGLWVEGAEYIRFEAGRSVFAKVFSGGKMFCVLNPEADDGIIYDGGELYTMPRGYSCVGSQVLAVRDGQLYVALSSREGRKPIVWHGDRVDSLRMNGYLCSVSFTDPTSPR